MIDFVVIKKILPNCANSISISTVNDSNTLLQWMGAPNKANSVASEAITCPDISHEPENTASKLA